MASVPMTPYTRPSPSLEVSAMRTAPASGKASTSQP